MKERGIGSTPPLWNKARVTLIMAFGHFGFKKPIYMSV
jgi:hypothetical protein